MAGISSYIYFPSVAFLICILLGLMILKPFRLNEIALFIVGFITPYYFHAVYLFLSDRLSFVPFFIFRTVPYQEFRLVACGEYITAHHSFSGGRLLCTKPFAENAHTGAQELERNVAVPAPGFFVPFINSDQSFHTWILVAAPFAAFHACAYLYPPKLYLSIDYILGAGDIYRGIPEFRDGMVSR